MLLGRVKLPLIGQAEDPNVRDESMLLSWYLFGIPACEHVTPGLVFTATTFPLVLLHTTPKPT